MIKVIPLNKVPIIKPGANINEVIINAIRTNDITIKNGDIIVIAHKIISRATNRIVKLEDIKPSQEAEKIAQLMNEDPRKVQVILNESRRIIKNNKKHLITESKLGFICANSGVDRSNAYEGDSLILLPKNPQEICERIRKFLEEKFHKKIGVLITDTHGRALRKGAVGVAIAVSGIPAIISYKGRKDIFGYELKSTNIAVADEIASCAELIMGEADEKIPIVLIRGLQIERREGNIKEVIYEKKESLFY
ncbi:MAG: coenzyme F420-0:L-glutamate ligase [Candidatus Odinarchaeia archaeon]